MHPSPRSTGLNASLVIALTAVLTSGCSAGADGQGGAGLPQLHADEQVNAASTAFEGVLDVASNGCMRVRLTSPSGDGGARWAVWPQGAELVSPDTADPSYAQVRDQSFHDQDQVAGTALLVTLADLPGGQSPGSYFDGQGRYCDAQDSGVIVIDGIQHAQGITGRAGAMERASRRAGATGGGRLALHRWRP